MCPRAAAHASPATRLREEAEQALEKAELRLASSQAELARVATAAAANEAAWRAHGVGRLAAGVAAPAVPERSDLRTLAEAAPTALVLPLLLTLAALMRRALAVVGEERQRRAAELETSQGERTTHWRDLIVTPARSLHVAAAAAAPSAEGVAGAARWIGAWRERMAAPPAAGDAEHAVEEDEWLSPGVVQQQRREYERWMRTIRDG